MGSFNNLLLGKQLMTDMIAVAYNYLSTYVRYGSVGTNLISQEKQTKDSRRPPMYLSGGNTRAGCPSWCSSQRARAMRTPPTGWTTRPRPAKLWPGPRRGHLSPRQKKKKKKNHASLMPIQAPASSNRASSQNTC